MGERGAVVVTVVVSVVVVVIVISILVSGTVAGVVIVFDVVLFTATATVASGVDVRVAVDTWLIMLRVMVCTSVTVFVKERVIEINLVDVRVLVLVASPGMVIVIMASWVLVLVSVSVSVFVTISPAVLVTVMNCVVVLVTRSGGTSGALVGGTAIVVEVISPVLPGSLSRGVHEAVTVVVLGARPPLPRRVVVIVLVAVF